MFTPNIRQYNSRGIAGLVTRVGHYSIYVADQAGIDADPDQPWVTVCEKHGAMMPSSTREQARASMDDPSWCEGCQGDDMERNGSHSRNATVVEYAVQEMFKGRGKSAKAAATATAKKLNGYSNVFISPVDPVDIDAKELEAALWDRMADVAIKAMPSYKRGKEDWAVDGTLQHFKQKPEEKQRLMGIIVSKLGYDPFSNGLTPNGADRYYVWLLDYRGVPLDTEGPYGPHTLESALPFARIGAKEGDHDRVVSYGSDPEASSFEIVAKYRRGTGARMM